MGAAGGEVCEGLVECAFVWIELVVGGKTDNARGAEGFVLSVLVSSVPIRMAELVLATGFVNLDVLATVAETGIKCTLVVPLRSWVTVTVLIVMISRVVVTYACSGVVLVAEKKGRVTSKRGMRNR